MAGSTCSLPAFWCKPTTCEGLAGLMDLILSVVLIRLPPMIRSYSRPSWPRTFSMAARIWRALFRLVKSVSGSFTNGPSCRRVCGRVGASTVAMSAPRRYSMPAGGCKTLRGYCSTGKRAAELRRQPSFARPGRSTGSLPLRGFVAAERRPPTAGGTPALRNATGLLPTRGLRPGW